MNYDIHLDENYTLWVMPANSIVTLQQRVGDETYDMCENYALGDFPTLKYVVRATDFYYGMKAKNEQQAQKRALRIARLLRAAARKSVCQRVLYYALQPERIARNSSLRV